MSRRNYHTTENQQESDARSSNSRNSKNFISQRSKKKLFMSREHHSNKYSSYESSSIINSLAKINDQMESQRLSRKTEESNQTRVLPSFTERYLPKGATPQQIYQEMLSVSAFKDREIQALRVYRDELKLIAYNSPYSAPVKVSIKLLQEKAQAESRRKAQRQQLLTEIKEMQIENKNIKEYTQIIFDLAEDFEDKDKFLDMGKEKELMVENIKNEIIHIVQELESEKRKNLKEVRAIQDQIYNLRIKIKEKEDRIREMKARICTHYIKLHSRNSSGTRSKDKNMSMSVRKFNTEKNETIREIFIGNSQFKKFSKQIIEKVETNELLKIKFYVQKDKRLTFQCIYDKKQGILHSHDFDYGRQEEQFSSKQENQTIFAKYLMSIKFFFKSCLVGVECRIKTEKGNKHVQIGNCESHVEHELVTLVNKKLMTLGSYWHGKDMIGVSVWFMQQPSVAKKPQPVKKPQEMNKGVSFEQYFT